MLSLAASVMAKIAIAIAVPLMIVIEPAAIAFPIAIEEAISVVMGPNPEGAGVG